jgi:hypothetical protein
MYINRLQELGSLLKKTKTLENSILLEISIYEYQKQNRRPKGPRCMLNTETTQRRYQIERIYFQPKLFLEFYTLGTLSLI